MVRCLVVTFVVSAAWVSPAHAGSFTVGGSPSVVSAREKRARAQYYKLEAPLRLNADGGVLELTFRELRGRRQEGKPATGTITVERDETHRTVASLDFATGSGRPLKVAGAKLGQALVKHVQVPSGSHRYVITADAGGALLTVKIAGVSFLEPGKKLGEEKPIPEAASPPPAPKPEPKPEPKAEPPPEPKPEPTPAQEATPASKPETLAPEEPAADTPAAEPAGGRGDPARRR